MDMVVKTLPGQQLVEFLMDEDNLAKCSAETMFKEGNF